MKSQNNIGKLIFFDGPDGVGKTTQIEMATETLQSIGQTVYVTRAHGGTPFGEKLREVSLSDTPRIAETDLWLSRAIHAELASDLDKQRQNGQTCLVDRSAASMWAYQVCASGLSPDIAQPVIKDDFKMFSPDLLIIFNASYEVLRRRTTDRSGPKRDYFESMPRDAQEKMIAGYNEAAELYGGIRIDASDTADIVHETTMRIIDAYLS